LVNWERDAAKGKRRDQPDIGIEGRMGSLLSMLGWNYLTPQGIRFGAATLLALLALAPNRSSVGEVLINLVLIVGAVLSRKMKEAAN
jgi:hypothetical protein